MAQKKMDGKDLLENPVPTAGTGKRTVDAVLGLIRAGNGVVSLLAGLLASALILYSGYVLYDSFYTETKAQSSFDLLKYKPEIIEDNPTPMEGGDTLASINQDYRAWLSVYDTTIDYPVVQGENDLYYASHDIYHNNSLTGAIYLAAGNSRNFGDSYNLIYGHHMSNGAMFGSLDDFRGADFRRSHQTGILVGSSNVYDLTLFAVAETDAYENEIYSVGNRAAQVREFLTKVLGGEVTGVGQGTRVLHYDQAVAASASKILALSTCASEHTDGRLAVFFRMTRRDVGRGSLTVRKVWTGDEDQLTEEQKALARFVVTGPSQTGEHGSGFRAEFTWADMHQGEKTFEHLVTGEYTVTESVPQVENFLITAEYAVEGRSGGTAAVREEENTRLTVTNTVDSLLRNLVITKRWTGDTEGLTEAYRDGISFVVTGPDDFYRRVSYSQFRNDMITIRNLPFGSYSVEETGQALEGYEVTPQYEVNGRRTRRVELTREGAAITVTNSYRNLRRGSLTLEKSWAGRVTEIPAQIRNSIVFRVTGPNGYTAEIPYSQFTGNRYTLTDLFPGEYTVREEHPSMPAHRVDPTFLVDGQNTATVQINGPDVTMRIRNSYRRLFTLTVHYVYRAEDGTEEELLNPTRERYAEGERYAVYPRPVPGYRAEEQEYTGTIEKDTELYIYYTREQHTLTILYQFKDGTEAAPPHEEKLWAGDEYRVENPEVEGYTTGRKYVTGVMEGRDLVVTVIYSPAEEALIGIDEYETPLGIHQQNLQIGLCIE